MNTQTTMLLAATALAALHFLPYLFAYLKYWGISGIVSNRENMPTLPAWAQRAKAAHQNMNENFVHFAVLVLVANHFGITTQLSALGAMLFFYSRICYLITFIVGIKWFRSLFYTAGLVGEAFIFYAIIQQLT